MLGISNTKKTRFKLAIALEVFFCIVVIYGLYLGESAIVEKTLTAMLTVGTSYLLGDSYRPSNKPDKPE